ncbi:GNAT family N-acetyltransferase [Aestuariivirga sp.]|uniref:GNAT family N-acetyltransferase n=1 Tax=Aestuariivirga sp. TaxID=2650926 RepID=UPI0039E5471A
MEQHFAPAPSALRVDRADLTLRLASGPDEIEACQRLRYRVFYEELAAKPDAAARASRRDSDRFDAICDHLVVVRQGTPTGDEPILLEDGELVGTYRLLRQSVAERNGGFYTQNEFDVAPMIAAHPELNFLELGRSCVLSPYRTKPVVELLWQGIWNYVRAHGLDVMFGCASLEGTDPAQHADALSFLASIPVPDEWRVKAQPAHAVTMAPRGKLDTKAALRSLPPLVKGYMRLGCYFGQGAVVDHQFNTTDILIVLPVSAIDPRYFAHFGQPLSG